MKLIKITAPYAAPFGRFSLALFFYDHTDPGKALPPPLSKRMWKAWSGKNYKSVAIAKGVLKRMLPDVGWSDGDEFLITVWTDASGTTDITLLFATNY